LRYSRARYYHPGLQRFISEDPLGLIGGDANLYAYVFNEPTLLADPLGLEPITISAAAAAAIVCAVGAAAGDVVVLSVSGRKATWGELAAGAGIGCAGGVAVLGASAVIAGSAVAQAATSVGAAAASVPEKVLVIGQHAAERMAQYGISERMIRTALQKGERYWDPLHSTFNYILRQGFASGKDLLVGQNPVTQKITTAFPGRDLVVERMVRLP
jgi:uncharacterized protein RhaS with RHS repeats